MGREYQKAKGIVVWVVISLSAVGLAVLFVLPESVRSEEMAPPRTIETTAEWQIALAREGFRPDLSTEFGESKPAKRFWLTKAGMDSLGAALSMLTRQSA